MGASAIARTLTAALTLTATLVLPDASAADWEVLGRQGRMQFVLVAKSHAADRQFFERAAKTLCPPGQVCQVMFWTDRKYVATRTPFTDAQLSQLAAQYNQNPNTGFVQLLMPCRIDPNPNRCFK
jgi:hypothetical protein